MIEELLDKYHVDDFDDLLIEIIKRMKEKKKLDLVTIQFMVKMLKLKFKI